MRVHYGSLVLASSVFVGASICGAFAPGCTPKSSGVPALGSDVGGAASAASATTSATASAITTAPQRQAPRLTWVEATRNHQWRDAARLIDALDAKAREIPKVRYVRARAALALEHHARAAELLEGLEEELPLLKSEIEMYRAESQLVAGPFDVAAKYFSAQSGFTSMLKAARAHERAGDLKQARALADRAVRHAQAQKLSPERIAPARHLRARLASLEGDDKGAANDWRWLALEAPHAPEARHADNELLKLQPKQPLTKQQRYDRAMALAREGQVEGVEQELAKLDKAPGKAIPQGELLHARGWAWYVSRRDYARAADLLTEAAETGTKYKVKDLYYAARARSRSHEDERAIELYLDLEKRFPTSNFAEDARFRVARLRYILGQWKAAVTAHTAYLKKYPRGSHRITSKYERAVAWLADGESEQAAKAFDELIPLQSRAVLQASYRELKGVALIQAGKKEDGIAELKRVIAEEPLSLPALFAAARLREVDERLPPPIANAPPSPAREKLVIHLPAKVKLLQSIGLDGDAEQELVQFESQIRGAHGARGHEAVCQTYSSLSGAARTLREGRRAARWKSLQSAPSPSSQWLWDCMYPRPYASLVRLSEEENGLPRHLVYAVMRQESGFRPAVVSPANAVGLMQIIPPTAEAVSAELGLEYQSELMVSPPYNIRLGAFYLKKVLTRFGGHAALAAASYNAGPSAVSRWLETGEKLPVDVFVARIPYRETRLYVHLVMGNLAHYAYLEGGVDAVPKLDLELPRGLRATADDY